MGTENKDQRRSGFFRRCFVSRAEKRKTAPIPHVGVETGPAGPIYIQDMGSAPNEKKGRK